MRPPRVGATLCALALANSALALPKDGDPRDPPENTCVREWLASTCADETYTAPSFTESVRATAAANQTSYAFFFGGQNEPPFDLALYASIASGEGAAGIIIDTGLFLTNLRKDNPALATDLDGAVLACILIGLHVIEGDCSALISGVLSKVDQETYKASSLWWQGCWHSDSQVSKSFSSVPKKQGYIVAAATKASSSADVLVTVTHHLPRQTTARICSITDGAMPADGTYQHHRVGDPPGAPAPQHGGTVANLSTTVHSPMGRGTFSVETTGIYFTGTVNRANCSGNR